MIRCGSRSRAAFSTTSGNVHQLLEQLDVSAAQASAREIEIALNGVRIALGGAEDAAQPRVRHLHVEDGILVGLLLGQVDVEVERACALSA